MHAHSHAARSARNRRIDETRVTVRQLTLIVAALPRAFPQLRIAQISEIGIVELQVSAPCLTKQPDFDAVRCGDIGVEELEIRIRFATDRFPATAKVKHRGGWNRHLGRAGRHRLQELEVVDLNRFDMSHRTDDVHHGRRKIDRSRGAVKACRDATFGHDAGELLEKVDVEIRAAKLTVRNAVEPGVLLHLDDVTDRGIFDVAQCGARAFAFGKSFTRIEQLRRPQETADMIGPEGRGGTHAHGPVSSARAGEAPRCLALSGMSEIAAGRYAGRCGRRPARAVGDIPSTPAAECHS